VYGRFGEEVEMVTRVSAQMGFPNEFRIPIGRSHTEMVKFPSKIDPAYRSLVSHVVTFLHEISKWPLVGVMYGRFVYLSVYRVNPR
jgi:hypothetical protein